MEEIHSKYYQPLGALAHINPPLTKKVADSSEVSFVGMSAVTENGVLTDCPARPYLSVKNGFTRFQNGDVLLAKITPCMENGKGAHAKGLINGVGCGSTEFHVLRASENTAPDYIFQITRDIEFRKKAEMNMTGSAGQRRVPSSFLNEYIIFAPPLPQQQKIALILTTVDKLIEQTQALIDKYTAIKQGMMADLFTRGIDLSGTPETNSNYGQLRPSVEQAPELYKETELGWVPKEWEVTTLQEVSRVERGKFTHRPRDDSKCYGGTHPFIQTGSVTKANGGFIRNYSQTLSEFGRSVSKEFPVGTIAVTIAANIADTAILDMPMCFPDSVVGVVVNEDVAEVRFIEVIIKLNKPRLDALAPLSAQKNINLEDLRPLKIRLPPMKEQRQICNRYNTIQKNIDTNIVQMEKLKLQKKGLMQDLLTGKVQVNA